MVNGKQWILKNVDNTGGAFNYDFGSEDSTFELVDIEYSENDLADGELLIKVMYLANDPAQKFWIAPVDRSYSDGIKVGDRIPSQGLAKVLASKSNKFKEGDYIVGFTGWATHAVVKDSIGFTKISPDSVKHLWWYMSVFGSTALTAYFALTQYAGLQEREADYGKVFLVSGAAGAVGSMTIQLASNIFKASKIIAIAGGPEKVKFVESFGKNVIGVDYKATDFKEKLLEAAGGQYTVDYFVDNVGGEVLDTSIKLLKLHATIVAVGAIAGYNDRSKGVFKNYMSVITKRLTIHGFIVSDLRDKFPEALAKLSGYLKEGKLDPSNISTVEDATGDNFKKVPLIWNGLFHGANKGRLLTKISE
ncbi:HFR134Cp [Eremothecium sinecaudum]|uniref:HFR134Cp n=1 Tax=Eremothecium sinecaudum TaxID=45286 RepID=A0A0X8HUY2_9SACH|nr:HFR134Cp [Eremothecium sinecaudum]AMD21989.1 HFR134Cp [Eremothecium sinecaudum]